MTGPATLRRMWADRRASAAAEMALVLPLLTVLLFGSIEIGNYFMNNHIVAKAVRDGARYASRLPMTSYPSCSPNSATVTKISNVVRTGTAGGDQTKARLNYWAETMGGSPTVTVTAACNTSGTYTGIYKDLTMGAPVVTVSATVPYPSLFGMFGLFSSQNFSLRATSRSAVMGV